jgi:hypothetical protein
MASFLQADLKANLNHLAKQEKIAFQDNSQLP